DLARLGHELGGLDQHAILPQALVQPPEIRLHLVLSQVDGGGDDVARRLPADLDEVLAQIGLDHLEAGALEVGIEADLLRDHRLALGDDARARLAANRGDDLPRILGRGREVHSGARFCRLPLELLQVEIEMRKRVVLDGAAALAQRLELGQPGTGGAAPRRQPRRDFRERALQLRVGECCPRIGFEGGRGGSHGRSQIAGSESSPARTSATCRTAILRPWRDSLPAMFIRQPRSPASSMPAPVAAIRSALRSTMALEMSGYLTEKVPPKPQQTSASPISTSSSPLTVRRSCRGCSLTPSSRSPEQLSW